MKAMVYTEYGPPEVLSFTEVEKPAFADDEVLLEVHASSLNFGDVALLKGSPFVANRSVSDYARVLNPGGTYVACAFNATSLILGPVISRTGSKKIVSLIHKPNVADLLVIKDLFEDGKVISIIDSCYPLSELAGAVRHFEAGNPRGKVVIKMEKNNG